MIQDLRRRNPWLGTMRSMMANMIMNQMAAKASEKAEERRELRRYKAAGYRESEAHKPDVIVAGKGLVSPKKSIQYVNIGGKTLPVVMKTPYGGTPEPVHVGSAIAPVTKKEEKVQRPLLAPEFDPKTGLIEQYLVTYNKKTGKWEKSKDPIGTKQPGGFKFKTTPEGGVEFASGAYGLTGIGEPTKAMTTELQKSVRSLAERKDRLETIMSKWQPEYNTWLTRATMWGRKLQEKAQGIAGIPPLKPAEQQELQEFTSFKTESMKDFSALIHDLAGSALTPLEAKIHRQWIQDAEKDSPTEYATKLQEGYKMVRKQLAREHFYLNIKGMNKSDYDKLRKKNQLSMAEFDAAVDRSFSEYVTKIRAENPNKPYNQVKAEAKELIKAMYFGF